MVKKFQSELGEFEEIVSDPSEPYYIPTTELSVLIIEEEPKLNHEELSSRFQKFKPRKFRSKEEIKCLALFKKIPSGIPPKKEYIRCRVIRGHKRANRQATMHTIPTKTINKISTKNVLQIEKWNKFKTDSLLNQLVLGEISKTENGPMTDGISKRKKGKVEGENVEKTFNDEYCGKYFANPIVRRSFEYYINTIFSEKDLNVYCDKFKMLCCNRDMNHNLACEEKWKSLETFLKTGMIDEVLKTDSDHILTTAFEETFESDNFNYY